MLAGLKASSLACEYEFYRTEHNAWEEPHIIEFLRSWNAEMKYTDRLSSKSRWEKWGYLSSYNVYVQSNGSFSGFSADESKKFFTVWEKYLSAPERSY